MSPRRLLGIGMLLIALLAVPRESAAIFAWIHEMSGPRMIGIGYTCKPFAPRPFKPLTIEELIEASQSKSQREQSDAELTGLQPQLVTTVSKDKCFGRATNTGIDTKRAHFWARYEGFVYASYDHEADPENHTVAAVSQGLMLEVSPVHPLNEANEVVLFFGAGVEVFRFFGDHFKPLMRTAIKLRPVGVRLNKVGKKLKALELAVDVRHFDRRFIPQDFGVPSLDEVGRGGEWVLGTFVSLVFH